MIHNRIIKTTMGRLIRCDALESDLRNRLLGVYRRLHDVTPLDLCPNVFARVMLHRNNAFYGFLLHVCRLIYDNLLIDEKTGEAKFKDFLRDERKMARLFERFVYNFFRREQTTFQVKGERIDWQDVSADEDSLRLLPTMNTDVSLLSSDRHIVFDAKYYVNTLQSHYGSETVHSGNLYQMFAYLKNLQCAESGKRKVEGVLLYPTVAKTLDLEYSVHGHRLRVATLDLNTHWTQIRQRLLELLN